MHVVPFQNSTALIAVPICSAYATAPQRFVLESNLKRRTCTGDKHAANSSQPEADKDVLLTVPCYTC
jgi:hypothetical protein